MRKTLQRLLDPYADQREAYARYRQWENVPYDGDDMNVISGQGLPDPAPVEPPPPAPPLLRLILGSR